MSLEFFRTVDDSLIYYPDHRPMVKALLDPTQFNTYDLQDKKVLAKMFLVDKDKRLSVLSEEEEQKLSIRYNTEMRTWRTRNIDTLTAMLWNNNEQHLIETYRQYFNNYIDGFDLLYDIVADKYLSII